MRNEKIRRLIKQINDPEISTLADIAKLSYPTFIRRVGKKLLLVWSHHLYQCAIHSSDEGEYRAKMLRNNPQYKNIVSLWTHPISKEKGEYATVSTKNIKSGEK